MSELKDRLIRSEMVLGKAALEKLSKKRVIIFGVGGVGSWCAESLIRTGLMDLTIVDGDTVQDSNVNRQLMATTKTIGMSKTDALGKRLREICPEARVTALFLRLTQDNIDDFSLQDYDCVVDAIDSVSDKAALILRARELGIPIFSSMGAARRSDPTQIRVSDFSKVQGDGLAQALRKRFKRLDRWPGKFLCVHSLEIPLPLTDGQDSGNEGGAVTRGAGGSILSVTGCFGFFLGSLVIKEITKD